MITGHCECGRVSFEASAPIEDFSHCHCSQCRRLHGAAYASFAGVKKASFRYLNGEPSLKHYASSAGHDRIFCGVCGSNIMVALESERDDYYICMGVVDGDPALPTGYHIYAGSKAPWHEITDDLNQFDEDTS